MLDRNGLRPARWLLTSDRHFLVASEAGVWELPAERITRKGKLGPGEMMAIDLKRGDLLDSDAIDRINRGRAPYKQWLQQGVTYLQTELIDPSLVEEPFDEKTLRSYHKLFQLTNEEVEFVLRPLAETEQEATGSMGDDTPMAVLSRQTRPLYDYFRQAFAQVTNPPIDPLREDCVMSLTTQLGRETNIFHAGPETVNHVILNSPVLSQRKLRQLLKMQPYDEKNALIDLSYSHEEGLKAGIERICAQAEAGRARRHGHAAAERPLPGRRAADGACAARHRRGAPPPGARRPALRRQPDHRNRHRARPAPHRLPARLRRDRGVSVPGLPDPVRPGPSRHPAPEERRRAGADRPQLPQGHLQGPVQDHLQDGHLHHRQLPRRAAVRDRGPAAGRDRPVFPGYAPRASAASTWRDWTWKRAS